MNKNINVAGTKPFPYKYIEHILCTETTLMVYDKRRRGIKTKVVQ